MIVAALAVGVLCAPPLVAGAVVRLPRPGTAAPVPETANAAVISFLRHYELRSGRVVRWDQGGDTVSEGEAYAMLLSVAAGDSSRFHAAWAWTRTHLLQPSGLLAWHWDDGRVQDAQPAADADVDAAFALDVAAGRFHDQADRQEAVELAAAVASQETAAVPALGRILVAGPWAVGPPAYVDPSYADPAELEALAGLGPSAAPLAEAAAGMRALVTRILSVSALPPDWVQVGPSGVVSVSAPPGAPSGDLYGFDAVRLPIRWAASCDPGDRRLIAALGPTLGPRALFGGPTVDLTTTGRTSARSTKAPVGLVAAAAAAWARGQRRDERVLLDRAGAADARHPSYYSGAWVALGWVLLGSSVLGTCG